MGEYGCGWRDMCGTVEGQGKMVTFGCIHFSIEKQCKCISLITINSIFTVKPQTVK